MTSIFVGQTCNSSSKWPSSERGDVVGSRDLHLQSSIMVWGGLESSSELTSKYDDNDDFLATFTIANEAANSLPPLVHMTWQIVAAAAAALLGCGGVCNVAF